MRVKEWCLIHYKLTFVIVIFIIFAISIAIEQILTILNNKNKIELIKILLDKGYIRQEIDEVLGEKQIDPIKPIK